jgi:hypothetical protein
MTNEIKFKTANLNNSQGFRRRRITFVIIECDFRPPSSEKHKVSEAEPLSFLMFNMEGKPLSLGSSVGSNSSMV